MHRKIRNCVLCTSVIMMIVTGSLSATPVMYIDFVSTPDTSTENTGVSGRLTLSFSENAGVNYLSLTIANTTPISLGSYLTAIGLEIPDELNAFPVLAKYGNDTYFDRLTYNVGVSPGWMNAPGGYDLMITSDGSFEGGSAIGAPAAQEARTVLLILGNSPYDPQQCRDLFADFYAGMNDPYAIARFQAVGPDGEDSDKVLGTHMPEPASCVLLAVGLWLTHRSRRRHS